MTKHYRVMWEFDVEDVATPREAAQQAFAAMQREGTSANVFQVRDVADVTGTTYHVDLDDATEDHEVVA